MRDHNPAAFNGTPQETTIIPPCGSVLLTARGRALQINQLAAEFGIGGLGRKAVRFLHLMLDGGVEAGDWFS